MDAQPKSRIEVRQQRAKILGALSSREWRALRRQARRNARNVADAEDALQTACMQFMRFYDGPADYALRWLSVVVKRCAWAIGRQERRRGLEPLSHIDSAGEEGAVEIVLVDPSASVPEAVERRIDVSHRVELLDTLKSDERTALILLGFGASYEEIGELRGWSRTKVNRCISEGRAALRRRLADEEGG